MTKNPFAVPNSRNVTSDKKLPWLSKAAFVLSLLAVCLMAGSISFVIFAIAFLGNGPADPQSKIHGIVGSIFATGAGLGITGLILGSVARRSSKNWANLTACIVGGSLLILLGLVIVGGVVEFMLR